MSKRVSVSFIAILLVCLNLLAHEVPFAWISHDTLVVNDGMSEQKYLFEEGGLNLVKMTPFSAYQPVSFPVTHPDRNRSVKPYETKQNVIRFEATVRTVGYYQLELYSIHEDHEVLRTLRKYDGVPGIEWGMSVKGNTAAFQSREAGGADLIEDPDLLTGHNPYYFFLPFSSPHYTTSIFSFQEATDHHTNIVSRRDALPYRKSQYYRGSLLLAKNNQTHAVHLVAKKSPIEGAQSNYAGYDFSSDFAGIKVHSPGLYVSPVEEKVASFGERASYEEGASRNKNREDGEPGEVWHKAYSVFVLMYAESEHHALEAYKLHELAIHRYLPERDNTFTMNTWGDRNRDSRVNEEFILNELEVAARLGVTHYQIDDGWQQGLSRNSAAKAGMLWDDWKVSDWEVNRTRFPNGLAKVKEKSDRLGMNIGLWFNPSKGDNYALWERDQKIVLDLHERYGISWIKIDGLEIGNKAAEEGVSKMLGGAIEKSEGKLQFNMDVTAGQRGGYFYFNHFGNTFLENRYTDWGNYYPHLTLRNAWTLAKYVPIQRFQIEWLNKWRNDNQYPANDPLRPANVPFDYQFAITMMGQPLAWMEATGLPEEAFEVVSLIEAWKSVRDEMQAGVIVPIGDEPNGYGFPGFVSYGGKRIFVLLFRENTSPFPVTGVYTLNDEYIAGKRFVRLGGEGVLLNNDHHRLEVQFQQPFQFLFGYFE